MHITLCPICKSMIDIPKPVLGETVECPDCGELFRVTATNPIELYYLAPIDDETLPEEEHRVSRLE